MTQINFIKFSSIFLLNILLIGSLVNCDTLEMLFIVHRHGDRTPVSPYPTDPYSDQKLWPDYFGQLTNAGKERMFNVGSFLRNKYDGFLTDSVREIYVRSSDKDRCLESAQLVVNGLYKPKGRWVWDKNENWLPVPIHTIPNNLDSMLYPASRCKAANVENDRIYSSSYVKSINEKYKNLYNYLTLNSGETVDNVLMVNYIYDTLVIEKEHNFTIPVWATPEVLDQMKECSIISFELFGFSRKIQKFRAGVFLHDLIERMKSASKSLNPKYQEGKFDAPQAKLYDYSSHDSFISVLLAGLQVNNGLPPPFGSTIIFELHRQNETEKNWDESSFVKIFYLNETEKNNPYSLNLPICKETDICTLKQLISSVSDLLINPENWDSECENSSLLDHSLNMTSGNFEMEKINPILF